MHTMLENALWRHARIQVHAGKTNIWNRAGVRSEACNFLERRARLVLEGARVWRGGLESETHDRGIKILGTPLGHSDYVAHQLQLIRRHQQTLLGRIPALPDVQSARALLLHCGATRANNFLRVIPPPRSLRYAQDHDEAVWNCVCGCTCGPLRCQCQAAASLPLAFGGLGMRSAVRTSTAAYWASWGDSLEMIAQRHPSVVDVVMRELNGLSISPHLSLASEAALDLARPPRGSQCQRGTSLSLAGGQRNIEDVEPGTHGGWQHEAAARMEWDFRVRMMATLAEPEASVAAHLKMSRVLPHPKFLPILGRSSLFQPLGAHFWSKRRPTILNFLPHPKCLAIFGRLLKNVLEFSNFWAGFVATQCPLSLVSCNNKRRHAI